MYDTSELEELCRPVAEYLKKTVLTITAIKATLDEPADEHSDWVR